MNEKSVIYIDAEDEITVVIDKLHQAPQRIVALVLPKRFPTLQSIVNMKLLQKSALSAKKQVVLITSDPALLTLAAATSVYVASTLQSKPAIPDSTKLTGKDEIIESSQPIGALATASAFDETIDVGDSDSSSKTPKQSPKKKTDKNKKVPNFKKFRLKIIIAIVALILLIGGIAAAMIVLPRANISVDTDTENVPLTAQFTVSTSATVFDPVAGVVPGNNEQIEKVETEKVAATGQKNVGEKATGTVSFSTACAGTFPTIPAGTSISASNLTFITQRAVRLETVDTSDDSCRFTGQVGVIAQNPGDAYNVSSRNYQVAGFPGVTAVGSDMTGGTNDIKTTVSQQDIDSATQRARDRIGETAQQELEDAIKREGGVPLPDTFNAGEPDVQATPRAGEEASEVSVRVGITYTMLGIRETDIKQLIASQISERIDSDNQTIINEGLDEASLQVTQRSGDDLQLRLQTIVVVGPSIDLEKLKQDIAGKRLSETQSIIRALPGVRDVTIDYSPFWVSSTPKNIEKIDIIIKDANENQSTSPLIEDTGE
jgi:hypothetical protein